MLVDKDLKIKLDNLFLDPDEFETEEEHLAAYHFPSTPEGKKMMEESGNSRSLSYQEFKFEIAEFLQGLKTKYEENRV